MEAGVSMVMCLWDVSIREVVVMCHSLALYV